jgi:hypothetical protein
VESAYIRYVQLITHKIIESKRNPLKPKESLGGVSERHYILSGARKNVLF